MLKTIRNCSKCNLCENQKPLIEDCKKCQICWVGLSAKIISTANEGPLSESTNTGKIICNIEEKCSGVLSYKTNLVKCVPLTKEKKLRYPSESEIDICFSHLVQEIEVLTPRIVFLLGNKVADATFKHYSINCRKWNKFIYSYQKYNGIYFIPVHHPSYIYVYKRKQIDKYISSLSQLIQQLI